MIRTILTSAALLCVHPLLAHEIDSRVIHNYSQIGLSYGYVHDIGNSDINAHGVQADYSFEVRNFIFHASGGSFWGDDDLGIDAELDFWNIAGGVGYVFRLSENHINIIPRFELGYTEISLDAPGFDTLRDDGLTILPGITLSYALNNRISVDGGYTYIRDIANDGEDSHGLTVGTRIALMEQLGLNIQAAFADGQGFSGITAGFSFHY